MHISDFFVTQCESVLIISLGNPTAFMEARGPPVFYRFINSQLLEDKDMKIRPLYDRLVVKRIEQQEQMQGGLYIPDTAKEKPQEGEVVAVGKGKRGDDGKLIPLDVQAGDRILFGKYSGSDIKIDGEEYLIMREDEVLGILDSQPVKAKKAS